MDASRRRRRPCSPRSRSVPRWGRSAILGVRDWRIYGLTMLWAPVISGWQTANSDTPAGARDRDRLAIPKRALVAGVSVGLMVSLKLFLWPLLGWLLLTRRWRAAGWAAISRCGLQRGRVGRRRLWSTPPVYAARQRGNEGRRGDRLHAARARAAPRCRTRAGRRDRAPRSVVGGRGDDRLRATGDTSPPCSSG